MSTLLPNAFALIFVAASLSGCGGRVEAITRFEIRVWVEDHPDLPAVAVIDGCADWRPEGVMCTLTTDPSAADVRVSFSADPCVADDNGDYTIAWASDDRTVHLRGACFGHDPDGLINTHDVTAVIGHEMGHQLGIWDHVPETCEGEHLTHPQGGPVCGQALMNAYYDPAVYFVTAVDGLAFGMRSTVNTVAPANGGVATQQSGPTCSLKRR